jgi:hypothetical protein
VSNIWWGSAVLLFGLLLVVKLIMRVFGDMASQEIRGRLELAPRAILRLAAAQLNREQRERLYHEEWLPELLHIMREAEGMPITGVFRALKFALGLLIAARMISRFAEPGVTPAVAADTSTPVQPDAEWTDENGFHWILQMKNNGWALKSEPPDGVCPARKHRAVAKHTLMMLTKDPNWRPGRDDDS